MRDGAVPGIPAAENPVFTGTVMTSVHAQKAGRRQSPELSHPLSVKTPGANRHVAAQEAGVTGARNQQGLWLRETRGESAGPFPPVEGGPSPAQSRGDGFTGARAQLQALSFVLCPSVHSQPQFPPPSSAGPQKKPISVLLHAVKFCGSDSLKTLREVF